MSLILIHGLVWEGKSKFVAKHNLMAIIMDVRGAAVHAFKLISGNIQVIYITWSVPDLYLQPLPDRNPRVTRQDLNPKNQLLGSQCFPFTTVLMPPFLKTWHIIVFLKWYKCHINRLQKTLKVNHLTQITMCQCFTSACLDKKANKSKQVVLFFLTKRFQTFTHQMTNGLKILPHQSRLSLWLCVLSNNASLAHYTFQISACVCM